MKKKTLRMTEKVIHRVFLFAVWFVIRSKEIVCMIHKKSGMVHTTEKMKGDRKEGKIWTLQHMKF